MGKKNNKLKFNLRDMEANKKMLLGVIPFPCLFFQPGASRIQTEPSLFYEIKLKRTNEVLS